MNSFTFARFCFYKYFAEELLLSWYPRFQASLTPARLSPSGPARGLVDIMLLALCVL